MLRQRCRIKAIGGQQASLNRLQPRRVRQRRGRRQDAATRVELGPASSAKDSAGGDGPPADCGDVPGTLSRRGAELSSGVKKLLRRLVDLGVIGGRAAATGVTGATCGGGDNTLAKTDTECCCCCWLCAGDFGCVTGEADEPKP